MAWRTEIDRNGNSNVFKLEQDEDGPWLNDNWTKPTNKWNPDNEIVFLLRKSFLFPALGGVFLFRVDQIIFPAAEHFAHFV